MSSNLYQQFDMTTKDKLLWNSLIRNSVQVNKTPLYFWVNQLSNVITIYLLLKYILTNYIFLAYYNQLYRHWLTCAFKVSYIFFFFHTLIVVWQYFSPRVPTKFLTNSITSGDWGCLGFQEIKNSATCTYRTIKISS